MLPFFFVNFSLNLLMKADLIEYLSNFVSDNRNQLFQDIIQWRTRYLTVVLEDIYQSQNASAVLRTCDCFGVQDVHVIENSNEYEVNPDVALGANQWLSLHKYNQSKNNTTEAINKLKADGYRIVATTPHTNDVKLEEFDLSKGKTALLFGTELRGLSDIAMEHADEFVKIPMYGFTESFNISVSAALMLHSLTNRLRVDNDINWQLNSEDKNEILINWYKSTIKDADGVISRFRP